MYRTTSLVAAFLLTAMFPEARTPAEVKRDLESVAPPNTVVRMAYSKGGPFVVFPEFIEKAAIYVVSSEDGVVRKISTVTGDLCMVNITADGKRVIFYDGVASRTYVVDWDGRNERKVLDGPALREYWRDPVTKTDWLVIEEDGLWRVNLDTLSKKVKLNARGNGDGTGLTDDGTKILVYEEKFGLAQVPSGSVAWGSGGCQGSVRAGSENQWGNNASGHGEFIVHNANGKVAFRIPMAKAAGSSTGEAARFTQHRDYFTFTAADFNNAGKESAQPKNPILMRLTDNKVVAIEHDAKPNVFIGDADAVFLPKSSSPVLRPSRAGSAGALRTDANRTGFDVRGRWMAPARSGHRQALPGLFGIRPEFRSEK